MIPKQFKHTAKLPILSSVLNGFKTYFLVNFFFSCVILYHFKLVMRWIVKGLIVENVTNVITSWFTYSMPFRVLVPYVSYVPLGLYVPSSVWLLHVSCFKVPYFLKGLTYIHYFTEVYLEPSLTSTIEVFFAKIVISF